MNPITSSGATGSFIPDSPSSERASRFSRVERRSTAKIAAESVAAIAAPTSIPSSVLRPKISLAPSPATPARTTVPTVARQRGRRAQHGADLRPAGGEPALEEDQHQRDSAQGPCQLGVVELDPPEALRADQHAQAEEEQQSRDAHPVGQQRPADAGGQQGAGEENQLGVVLTHRRTLGTLVDSGEAGLPRLPPAGGGGRLRPP